MIKNTVINAIQKINPNAEVSVSGNDINTIVWENGTTPISKSDIETKMSELQTEHDNNKYQRDREKEYLSKLGNWQNQLDMIYHDIDNWKSEVKKIKDANPKE
jgi:hypothetical protein